MKSKKFFCCAILLIAIILFVIGTVQIVIDPLFLYHRPFWGLQPVIQNEEYQNAGIAKNFEYDNVIIGNSMSENFRTSWFDEGFSETTVKLTLHGSVPLHWDYLLRIISNRNQPPKRIILNFDYLTLCSSVTESPMMIPLYLYDSNPLNDVNYLYNFSILKNYTLNFLKKNLSNEIPDIDQIYLWDDGTICNEDSFWEHYQFQFMETVGPEAASQSALENIQLLSPYFEELCDTEFIFFFSPWSITHWRDAIQNNEIPDMKAAFSVALEELSHYKNVTLYMWQDKEMRGIMEDMNNYKDIIHYSGEVNQLMAQRICAGNGIIQPDDYQSEMDLFFDYIENYDYSHLRK